MMNRATSLLLGQSLFWGLVVTASPIIAGDSGQRPAPPSGSGLTGSQPTGYDRMRALGKQPTQVIPEGAVPSASADTQWHLSAGAQWKQIGKLSCKSADLLSGASLFASNQVLAAPTNGNHYADGYVLPDSTNSGQTWNWGYTNASQVNGNTISFTGTQQEIQLRSMTSQDDRMCWKDDLAGAGPYVDLESPVLFKAGAFKFSFNMSYNFASDGTTNKASLECGQLVERTFVDTYDASGLLGLPSPGYAGTFAGPGPMLPTDFDRELDPSTSPKDRVYRCMVRQDLDVQVHTISLGPKLRFGSRNIQGHVGIGFAGNIANWKASASETLLADAGEVLKVWKSSASGTEFLPGAYGELGVEWNFLTRWSIDLLARYDYAKSLSVKSGPGSFDLDLQGVSGRVGLGVSF